MDKIHRIVYMGAGIFLAVILMLSFCIGNSQKVFALTDVQAAFENRNVLDDLENSVIGDKAFDIADYPFTKKGKPQLISFIEFGFSRYTEEQDDYALYVYIYNPQGLEFDTAYECNSIEFSYNNGSSYVKRYLEFLNCSNKTGYEGLFYKFKVTLSFVQKAEILTSISSESREYALVGMELSVGNVITDYSIAQTYVYSGFALGYGSESATESTLSCTVDGFEKYLELDVQSTYYRPTVTGSGISRYTVDTLHSVYFSVPNDIISEYGEMMAVHATWLNAMTKPMLITANADVYKHLINYIGQEITWWDKEVRYGVIGDMRWSESSPPCGAIAYNAIYGSQNDDWENESYGFGNVLFQLDYLFKVNDIESSIVSGEEVLKWLARYTASYGGALIDNRYSSALFDNVDDSYTDINISSDFTYSLETLVVSQTWWQMLFGDTHSVTSDYFSQDIPAIEKVTLSAMDHSLTEEIFCNQYYVDINDYDDFYQYVQAAESADETVYLFRYYVSDYSACVGTEYDYVNGNSLNGYILDTNAYFAQMWVQLGFDLIDLTFTKDNVSTVIPVVMSPMDIVADTTGAGLSFGDDVLDLWQLVLSILALFLIVVFLFLFLPYIVKFLIFVITLPFKAVAAFVKLFHKRE